MNKEALLQNVDKIHTTEMGVIRIKKNLKLDTDSDEGFLTDIKDELNSICKEDFSFIIMDKNSENLMKKQLHKY